MVARRTVLAASAGAVLVPMVHLATTADAATVPRPPAPPRPAPVRGAGARTLAASRRFDGGRLRVAEASFPLTHLGVTWRAGAARVRLRHGAGWTDWTPVNGCDGGPDGRGHRAGAALVTAPGAIGYEVAVSGAATVTELNTAQAVAVAAVSGMPLPHHTVCPVPYVPRAAWRANESLRFARGKEVWPAEFSPVQALTVHHTAGINGDPDPAATVRAIQYYQTVTLGWGDIGYHLLIDEAGRVYEGRTSGVDTTPVFGPTGADRRPEMVVAGHVRGFNAGNIGVCLLGTFTGTQPTAAARESLARVLGALSVFARLDVLSSLRYRDADSGSARTVRAISGHRNWAATACPGDRFYSTLDTLREQVADTRYRNVLTTGTGLPKKRMWP